MRCASALSTSRSGATAVREVLDRAGEALAGEPADLAVAFVSPHHAGNLDELAARVRERGFARHLLGCTGESIVGEDREIEGAAAISLWALRAPGVALTPLRPTADESALDRLGPAPGEPPVDNQVLIALGDPFSFPAEEWLKRVRAAVPGLRVVGGMASAGHVPGANRLLLDGAIFEDGGVAVRVAGPVAIRTVVSQGCRPIGRHLVVTKVDRNLIREIGRRPALEVFREVFEELDESDRRLVQQGLHVGRVINEYQDTFDRGDFLVSNVVGADESGAIAIGGLVRVGQTVQFHVRDAGTAGEDLRGLLDESRRAGPAAGALLFTCNGRGSRLFDVESHDVRTLRDRFGPIPVAGFFAMGEIGPIGGQNFVHGFTASIALFGP
jgi:small ligand-binding sensory domain FIST